MKKSFISLIILSSIICNLFSMVPAHADSDVWKQILDLGSVPFALNNRGQIVFPFDVKILTESQKEAFIRNQYITPLGRWESNGYILMDEVEKVYNNNLILKTDKSLWAFDGTKGPVALMENVLYVDDSKYTQGMTPVIAEDQTLWLVGSSYEVIKVMENVVSCSGRDLANVGWGAAVKEDASLWCYKWSENGIDWIAKMEDDVDSAQISISVNAFIAVHFITSDRQLRRIEINGNDGNFRESQDILSDVQNIVTGSTDLQMMVLKNDHTLWGWGANDYGQLGTQEKYVRSPQKIMDRVSYAFTEQKSHSVAIKEDNSLWTWGRNDYGQLGDATNTNDYRVVPAKIMDGVLNVNYNHNAQITNAIKTDGSLWVWGGDISDFLNTEYIEWNTYKNAPVEFSKLVEKFIEAVYLNNGTKVSINNKLVHFTSDLGFPFVDENDRTQVPLRATMEAFGATVGYDESKKMVYVQKGSTTVYIPIGYNYIIVNGATVENDTSAVIINDRTYCPIRMVLEAFGATVSWNDDTNTVMVKYILDATQIVHQSEYQEYRIDNQKYKLVFKKNESSIENAFVVDEKNNVVLSRDILKKINMMLLVKERLATKKDEMKSVLKNLEELKKSINDYFLAQNFVFVGEKLSKLVGKLTLETFSNPINKAKLFKSISEIAEEDIDIKNVDNLFNYLLHVCMFDSYIYSLTEMENELNNIIDIVSDENKLSVYENCEYVTNTIGYISEQYSNTWSAMQSTFITELPNSYWDSFCGVFGGFIDNAAKGFVGNIVKNAKIQEQPDKLDKVLKILDIIRASLSSVKDLQTALNDILGDIIPEFKTYIVKYIEIKDKWDNKGYLLLSNATYVNQWIYNANNLQKQEDD